jgi:DNA polymerase III alpha subunit
LHATAAVTGMSAFPSGAQRRTDCSPTPRSSLRRWRPDEVYRLFQRYPEALARTLEIAERCKFSLDELSYQHPGRRPDPGPDRTAGFGQTHLGRCEGASSRWRPVRGCHNSQHELSLIDWLQYAPYFLAANAIVRFAGSRGDLCRGRGSAARQQRRLLYPRHHLDRSGT